MFYFGQDLSIHFQDFQLFRSVFLEQTQNTTNKRQKLFLLRFIQQRLLLKWQTNSFYINEHKLCTKIFRYYGLIRVITIIYHYDMKHISLNLINYNNRTTRTLTHSHTQLNSNKLKYFTRTKGKKIKQIKLYFIAPIRHRKHQFVSCLMYFVCEGLLSTAGAPTSRNLLTPLSLHL